MHDMTEEKLLTYVKSLEEIEKQKSVLNDEAKSILADAKTDGIVIKSLKELIKIRATPKEELEKNENALDLYRRILQV